MLGGAGMAISKVMTKTIIIPVNTLKMTANLLTSFKYYDYNVVVFLRGLEADL